MADVLVAAARFERDRRERLARERAAEINRSSASPAEAKQRLDALCIDFQAWVAIAEWLDTGKFRSFNGGSDPEADDAPVVRWPELEAAAKSALHAVERTLAREGWFDGCEETETSRRRNALTIIHRKVQIQREGVDYLNRKLREPATAAAA